MMLKQFEVTGFKNFSRCYSIDFGAVRDYKFNTECVKEDIINNMLIYGKNASGKSNFGLAIFDIVSHLTDKNVTPNVYDHYLNLDVPTNYAEFRYVFVIDHIEIEYLYRKTDNKSLIWEKVSVNKKQLFEYDYAQPEQYMQQVEEIVPTLNFEFYDNEISMVKYLVNNAIGEKINPLKSMVNYVSNMLWSRSLDENRYIGCKTNTNDYLEFINNNDILAEFIDLLNQSGIDEKLMIKTDSLGEKRLYIDKLKPIPFLQAASNGTKALYTLFYWLKTIPSISFLFIDEFDAYYHFEMSETIVKILGKHLNFQTVLTSHNTNLLTNRIMRPDCYFIITNERITSIANATNRELREGHNLEKLYKNGEFDG